MKLGMVLGGGGVTGEAFHRGVLRAMAEFGLHAPAADLLVGTSAGSIVAASLRRHSPAVPIEEPDPDAAPPVPEPSSGRERLLDLLRVPRQVLSGALLWPRFMAGREDMAFIQEGLLRAHGERWPSAPLWIPAVRRRDGRRVVFGRPGAPAADVASAVAASSAVPGYFRPVHIDGAAYVDGGMHSPTNADLLAGQDLDVAVVSSPMSVDLRFVRAAMDLPLRLWCKHILHEELWVLRRRRVRVVTVEPDRDTIRATGLNMLRGHRLDEIEEHAYAHARRRLDLDLHARHPVAPATAAAA